MPVAVYPGAKLIGATARMMVSDSHAQFDAVSALHERYRTPFLLSAMDLSAEAEAFGADVHLPTGEVPTVTGRVVVTAGELERLAVPGPGDKRTRVYLETVRELRRAFPDAWVVGGCIGPFSLASRLHGVSEFLMLPTIDPEFAQGLLEKVTRFLCAYVQAFRQAGADAVIMAEPTAGLVSPSTMARFSSRYVREVVESSRHESFSLILHNCGAKPLHLSALGESEAAMVHFGAPMEMRAALESGPEHRVVYGNSDPTAVFVQASVSEVREQTLRRLEETAPHRNYVISSGCDLPPNTRLENLDAFYEAVAEFNQDA